MKTSPLAGKPTPPGMLVDVPRLITASYTEVHDPTVPASGWFAARPSGTENIYKIYAERASGERTTCAASWRKPSRLSAMHWPRPRSRQGFRPSQS